MSDSPYPYVPAPVPRAERENDPLAEKTLAEHPLVTGHFINVFSDDVELPDGRKSHRFCLRHGGAAAMCALDGDGTILLERQWRHPLRRSFWEIPAGKIDPNEEEEHCARRELREECGVTADCWSRLGEMNTAIGYSNERIAVYLAEGLHWGAQELDEGEHLEVVRVKLSEALTMCEDGRITDVKTIVALFYLERFLKKRGTPIA